MQLSLQGPADDTLRLVPIVYRKSCESSSESEVTQFVLQKDDRAMNDRLILQPAAEGAGFSCE